MRVAIDERIEVLPAGNGRASAAGVSQPAAAAGLNARAIPPSGRRIVDLFEILPEDIAQERRVHFSFCKFRPIVWEVWVGE